LVRKRYILMVFVNWQCRITIYENSILIYSVTLLTALELGARLKLLIKKRYWKHSVGMH
jgi:hypothetical protein